MTSVRHAALILITCALVYWPWLGRADFASSEGHRVVPGWTMLDTGNWTRLEMFGLAYLRKPPGMPWAIATSAAIFGESEWSARGVSAVAATLAALICWAFSRRWFGIRSGLAAGLAQALLPAIWLPGAPGRTAEIEMLLILGSQIAGLTLIHQLVFRPIQPQILHRPPHFITNLGLGLLIAVGVLIAGLTKSFAALPTLWGILIAACATRKSCRPLLNLSAMIGISIGVLVAVLAISFILEANKSPDAVRETGDFLWKTPGKTLLLMPIGFVSLFPVSLASLFIFGKDARHEASVANTLNNHDLSGSMRWTMAYAAARTLGLGWFAAAILYTLLGIDNPRYLLPASFLIPPIVGYIVLGVSSPSSVENSHGFTPPRRRIARLMLLGSHSGRLWWLVLISGAMIAAYFFAHREEAHAGSDIASNIAKLYQNFDADVLIADGVIEARPDVLLSCREMGCNVRWVKPIAQATGSDPLRPQQPSNNSLYLIRLDAAGDESARLPDLMLLQRYRLGRYELGLARSAAKTSRGHDNLSP